MQAQSAELDRLNKLQAEIDRDLKVLSQARDSTSQRKEASFEDLQLINQQVVLRERLLASMNAQIKALDVEIANITMIVERLEADLQKLREDFGRLMAVTYRNNRNKSQAFFLFSSESLSQAQRRLRYFKAIEKSQQAQLRLLRRTKAFLAKKQLELEKRKQEKVEVAAREQEEKKRVVALKEEAKAIYLKLKEDEKRFQEQIAAKEKEKAELDKLIQKELKRIAEAKAAENAKLTKIEIDVINKLSTDFAANKGKFPWPMPIPNAYISRHFGRQNIGNTNLTVDLQGVDITTLPDQAIRAIYAGKVETVMPVMGQGKMVIISHGNYYSVYANLSTVSVKVGQQVEMLDIVGKARTDAISGETKIHFQLYKDKTALDPEGWLVRKNS